MPADRTIKYLSVIASLAAINAAVFGGLWYLTTAVVEPVEQNVARHENEQVRLRDKLARLESEQVRHGVEMSGQETRVHSQGTEQTRQGIELARHGSELSNLESALGNQKTALASFEDKVDRLSGDFNRRFSELFGKLDGIYLILQAWGVPGTSTGAPPDPDPLSG